MWMCDMCEVFIRVEIQFHKITLLDTYSERLRIFSDDTCDIFLSDGGDAHLCIQKTMRFMRSSWTTVVSLLRNERND